MEKRKNPFLAAIKESLFLVLGEAIVSLIIVGVYLLIDKFSYKVVTGVLLGSIVIIANYLFLSFSINRAVEDFLAIRGKEEMDEEQLSALTGEQTLRIQNAAKKSYVIRTFSMLAALVVAFILEWFEVLATVIPLLMFRPIIYVTELIKAKRQKGGA